MDEREKLLGEIVNAIQTMDVAALQNMAAFLVGMEAGGSGGVFGDEEGGERSEGG